MMFSAKFFTVVAALFAVAVNGSVVGFAERGINDAVIQVEYSFDENETPETNLAERDQCYDLKGTPKTFHFEGDQGFCFAYKGGGCDVKHKLQPDLVTNGAAYGGKLKSYMCVVGTPVHG